MTERDGPTFLLTLRAERGSDGVHDLRALLKVLLRRYKLRCVDAYEIRDRSTQYATVFQQLRDGVARRAARIRRNRSNWRSGNE